MKINMLDEVREPLTPEMRSAIHSLLDTPVGAMPVVQLLVKDQYGARALHPHNDNARLFADIAKTKTITMQNVKLIMQLGYAVEYVHGEVM